MPVDLGCVPFILLIRRTADLEQMCDVVRVWDVRCEFLSDPPVAHVHTQLPVAVLPDAGCCTRYGARHWATCDVLGVSVVYKSVNVYMPCYHEILANKTVHRNCATPAIFK